jgi:hypothetical protein
MRLRASLLALLLSLLLVGCSGQPAAPDPPPRAARARPLRAFCVAAASGFQARDEAAVELRHEVEDTGLFAEVPAPYPASPRRQGDVQLNLERRSAERWDLLVYSATGEQVAKYSASVVQGERSERDALVQALASLLRSLEADERTLDRLERAPGPAPAAPAPAPVAVATPSTFTGGTFVLVIGIDDYKDPLLPKLRFAEADALAVYRFFATDSRSPTAPDRVERLIGPDATRLAILKAIREHLIAKARPEDAVILYFAGHGFADAKNETYLAAADTQLTALRETGIAARTLQEYWAEIPAARKVLITDACHGGGLPNQRGIGGVRVSPAPAEAGKASIILTASSPDEVSLEDESLGQGLFTTALLNGLRGDADLDHDGHVTVEELASYLKRTVPALAAARGGKQTPVIEGLPATLPVFFTR